LAVMRAALDVFCRAWQLAPGCSSGSAAREPLLRAKSTARACLRGAARASTLRAKAPGANRPAQWRTAARGLGQAAHDCSPPSGGKQRQPRRRASACGRCCSLRRVCALGMPLGAARGPALAGGRATCRQALGRSRSPDAACCACAAGRLRAAARQRGSRPCSRGRRRPPRRAPCAPRRRQSCRQRAAFCGRQARARAAELSRGELVLPSS